ncbi:hypothetical protein BJY54_000129 [Streptomyces nodosus]|nr:hypothetical protein [Streptomyces nodosus]
MRVLRTRSGEQHDDRAGVAAGVLEADYEVALGHAVGGAEVEVRRLAGPVMIFPLPLPCAVAGPPPVTVAFSSDAPLPPEAPAEEDALEDTGEAAESFEFAAESSFPWQAVSERPAARVRAATVTSERALFLPLRSVPCARCERALLIIETHSACGTFHPPPPHTCLLHECGCTGGATAGRAPPESGCAPRPSTAVRPGKWGPSVMWGAASMPCCHSWTAGFRHPHREPPRPPTAGTDP